jgi:hypothetical protein
MASPERILLQNDETLHEASAMPRANKEIMEIGR